MSTYDDELAFEEALRIQAAGAGAPTLTLDDVRGRARGIRRRRAAVVAGGAAALVAAAVLPVALLVGGGSSPDSLPPADATPTVIDSANPVPQAPSRPFDQRGTYLVGDEIHPAEGEPFTPNVDGEISTVIGLDDGRWVLGAYPDGGAFTVVETDSTGRVLDTYDALDGGLTSDDAGTAVAWIGTDSRPVVLSTDRAEPFRLPAELDGTRSPAAPLEILPGCTPEDCAVLVEVYDDSPDGSTQYSVSHTGEVLSLDRLGMLSITDLSPDGALVSGLVSADEFGQEYCSGVLVFATGEQLWKACDSGSFRFSPDGTAVLAIDANLDGLGHSFVRVHDAVDGSVTTLFERGTIFDETWASDDAFLVALQRQDGSHELVEVPTDGSGTTTVASVEGVPGDPEGMFRLTGR